MVSRDPIERSESSGGQDKVAAAGGASAPASTAGRDLVAAMHQQHVAINAREGCIHMGVHFYNTRAEIDRVIALVGH